MILMDKGYELTISREEAETICKFAGNVTPNTIKEMGLTEDETETISVLYEMLDDFLYPKQV